MTREIPQNRIIQTSGRSDIFGDVVETFNLDLSSNYGSIRTTGMKKVSSSITEKEGALEYADLGSFPATGDSAQIYLALDSGLYYSWNGATYISFSGIELPIAFANYNGDYYFLTNDFVYMGDDDMNDTFSKDTTSNSPDGETSSTLSDMIVFNGALYISGSNEIMKKDGTTWSTPVTTNVTVSTPHLMTVYANRLYLTDNFTTIRSINTSDAIVATGAFTLDTGLDNEQWSISFLESSKDRIWFGLTNKETGRGMVFQWDGKTEDTWTDSYELDSGVASGTIVGNIPHIIDLNGKVMVFSGSSFVEKARLFKKIPKLLTGANDQSNLRFIHPNGMTTDDEGRLLLLITNETEQQGLYEDTVPSGVYEYDPEIGLYHKYSLSYSPVGTTTVTDYGQTRLSITPGALFFNKTTDPDSATNGTLLAGAIVSTDANAGYSPQEYIVCINDTLDTTQKYGYFITSKIFSSSVEDTWKKIYAVYEKLLNSTDKIVVKYRTSNDVPTEATITWLDTDTFTTNDDISGYVAGNEVQVIQGTGSGKSAHISSISESGGTYTVNLDDTFTGVTGTARALFSKWIKAGEITDANPKNWQALTTPMGNTNPYMQYKVCMQFTGKNEMYKTRVISSPNVNE
jgi:hypothetical protein